MRRHSKSAKVFSSAFPAFLVLVLGAGFARSAEVGTIAGRLVDARDQPKRIEQAVVFLLDAKTGLPYVAETRKPLDGKAQLSDLGGFWHALTEADGTFRLENVPVGRFRLVAQSWEGTRGFPERRNTSETVHLHGAAENVEVKAAAEARAVIRPLGQGVLKVKNDPEEAGAYLLVSTGAMRGDPILSYYGWGESFLRNLVGITHMSEPRATFRGMPEDRDVHLSLFAYDNVSGSGGGTFRAGPGQVATIKIYASWSNGHDEPPARLLPLVEYLEEQKPSYPELMGLGTAKEFQDERGRLDQRRLWQRAVDNGEKEVTVPNVGTFRLLDIAAAESYRQLRKSHAARRRRAAEAGRASKAEAETDAEADVSPKPE